MDSPILNTGSLYLIKYPKSNVLFVFKLITKHEASLSYQNLYTFTDEYDNKIIITKGVYKNIIIKEYEEPPYPVIKRIDIPLPSQNINFNKESTEDDLYK